MTIPRAQVERLIAKWQLDEKCYQPFSGAGERKVCRNHIAQLAALLSETPAEPPQQTLQSDPAVDPVARPRKPRQKRRR